MGGENMRPGDKTHARRIDEILDKVRASGGRVTPQRVAIIKAAIASDHPSVEQVYQAVRAEFPMTSLATVYKTLSLLQEMGQAVSLGSGDDALHYDLLTPDPHAHALCLRCGRVRDLPVSTLPNMVSEANEVADGWRLSRRIDFWGLCDDCAREAATAEDRSDKKVPGT
jgi:Fur family transcriptional regulator, peroxide stress response regulator